MIFTNNFLLFQILSFKSSHISACTMISDSVGFHFYESVLRVETSSVFDPNKKPKGILNSKRTKT